MTLEDSLQGRFMKAWLSINNPQKDGVNPHFKSSYATLGSTLKEIRDACSKQGIAYVQLLEPHGDRFALCSKIINGVDELKLSTFPVSDPPNPQAFGSEMTYRKRQQAQADWGIAGEEDDDGNAAVDSANQSFPIVKRCTSCGTPYRFESQAQITNFACECGCIEVR